MGHIDYSKELNTFSYNFYSISPSTVKIKSETHARIVLSKLYYALFHRIMEELPHIQSLSGPGQHDAIHKILTKQVSHGSFYLELLYLFNDLKSFRVWADYQVFKKQPPTNFNVLFQKTYSKINAKKLIFS